MSVQGSAPAQAPSAAPSGSSSEGGQGGGAEAFDYKSAFKSTQKALSDTQSRLSDFTKQFESHKQQFSPEDAEVLKKIKGAFAPAEEERNPVKDYEQQLDFYIAQALEADKAGRPMPLTTNLAISHYKSLIENHGREKALADQVRQLEQKLNQLADPGHAINQQAYSALDSHIKRGLDQLYGAGDETLSQKSALFNAVGSQIAGVLGELQQKNPRKWDQMRRDPQALQDLANRALKRNIPPKAVQMLEEENLRNTEMPLSELRQAFKEAGQIQDPRERDEIQTKIRREILVRMHESGKVRVAK